jgi:hypothetical protein
MAESPFQYIAQKAQDAYDSAPSWGDLKNGALGAVDGVGLGAPSWVAGKVAGESNPFAQAKRESPTAYNVGELVSMVPLRTAALGGAASYGRRVDAANLARSEAVASDAALGRQRMRETAMAIDEARAGNRQTLEQAKDRLHADPEIKDWLQTTAVAQREAKKPVVTAGDIQQFNEQFGERLGTSMPAGYLRKLVSDHHAFEVKGVAMPERVSQVDRMAQRQAVADDLGVREWAAKTAHVSDGRVGSSAIRDFHATFGGQFEAAPTAYQIRKLVERAHVERDAKLAVAVANQLKGGAARDDIMRQLQEHLSPARARDIWNLSQAKT